MQYPVHADRACPGYELRHIIYHHHLARGQVQGLLLAPGTVSGVAEDGRQIARAQAGGEVGQLSVQFPAEPVPDAREELALLRGRQAERCGDPCPVLRSVSAPVSICPVGAAVLIAAAARPPGLRPSWPGPATGRLGPTRGNRQWQTPVHDLCGCA